MAETMRIFTNGKIYTVNKKQPWAEAVVVKGKKIVYVGDNKGAMAYAKDGAEVEDLGGRLMTPGFIDGHVHLFMAVVFKGLIRIAPTDELADMQKKVKDYIDAHPELDAYMGMGWPDAYFGEGGPNKADLDVVCSDKPIAILSSSGHVGWCNTKALEIAKIDRNTPDPNPAGGHVYIRDAEGNPTGYFKETETHNRILGSAPYIAKSTLEKSMTEFVAQCSELGLTSLVDCCTFEFFQYLMHEDLISVFDHPDCPIRLYACGPFGIKSNAQESFDEAVRLSKMYDTDNIRCKFFKIVNDGTLENASAAFPNPYPESPAVLPTLNADEIYHWGEECAKAGIDLNVHSIGSLTVHALLEAAGRLRAAGYNDLRIVCSHSAYVFPDDIGKFAEYNVIANTTARWFAAVPNEEILKEIDKITEAMAYPVNSILKAGGTLSLSSDYPTDPTTFLPMPNVEVAVTRQPEGQKDSFICQPEERLTMADVIEAYTINNAYIMRMEDRLGSIEPGKYADLIVFDQNLFEMDPYTIHDNRVVETIKDGVTRFKRD